MVVQSVHFSEKHWNEKDAEEWLKEHKYHPSKGVDKEMAGWLRYRIVPPNKFERFITRKLKNHINLIIGFE